MTLYSAQNAFDLTPCGQLLDTNIVFDGESFRQDNSANLKGWINLVSTHYKKTILILILGHFVTSSLSQKMAPIFWIVAITTTIDCRQNAPSRWFQKSYWLNTWLTVDVQLMDIASLSFYRRFLLDLFLFLKDWTFEKVWWKLFSGRKEERKIIHYPRIAVLHIRQAQSNLD